MSETRPRTDSIGKAFADKVEANELGLGPHFVQKLEENEPSLVDVVRGRAGTAGREIGNALSRLSQTAAAAASAAAETATALVSGPPVGSLAAALAGKEARHVAVPEQEIIFIEANQKVGAVEKILRQEHIHSLPVLNSASKRFEGVIDTCDLVTWAVSKFPKAQLNAWDTFREEKEFTLQPVTDLIDASWRDHFVAAAPETPALTLLEHFREPSVHRVFLRSAADKPLSGLVTQTDLVRLFRSIDFERKTVRLGELIHSKKVVSCYEGELVVSAFRLLDLAQVSACAVLDDQGKLVGAISSFDVTSGSQESIATLLYQPVSAFLKRGQPNAAKQAVSVHANDTFDRVLELMETEKVLHVFIVDDDGFPTGVITPRDLVDAFLSK